MKSGFVTIIGLPNAGKSTIINSLVGRKVAITSPKPQTTRNKILGIYNDADYQIIFADTPGVFKPKNGLGEYMMKSVRSALRDADLIVVVGDASKGVINEDLALIDRYISYGAPVIYAYNKTDLAKADSILYELNKLNSIDALSAVVPLSCKRKKNLDALLEEIKRHMPNGPLYFPREEYTDKSDDFLIAETIREKALIYLQQEIPHGVLTAVEKKEQKGGCLNIDAVIIAEKESHKPIIIGKDGDVLKKIGESARLELEKALNTKINLKLFVKIEEDWRNKRSRLAEFGYNDK